MQNPDLPARVEQAIQRIKEDAVFLQTYLKSLAHRGWEVDNQPLSSGGQVARYRANELASLLTVYNTLDNIRVEGTVAKQNQNTVNVDTIYNSARVCDDMQSAREYIAAESARLEEMVNEEHAATKRTVLRVA